MIFPLISFFSQTWTYENCFGFLMKLALFWCSVRINAVPRTGFNLSHPNDGAPPDDHFVHRKKKKFHLLRCRKQMFNNLCGLGCLNNLFLPQFGCLDWCEMGNRWSAKSFWFLLSLEIIYPYLIFWRFYSCMSSLKWFSQFYWCSCCYFLSLYLFI